MVPISIDNLLLVHHIGKRNAKWKGYFLLSWSRKDYQIFPDWKYFSDFCVVDILNQIRKSTFPKILRKFVHLDSKKKHETRNECSKTRLNTTVLIIRDIMAGFDAWWGNALTIIFIACKMDTRHCLGKGHVHFSINECRLKITFQEFFINHKVLINYLIWWCYFEWKVSEKWW